MAAVKRPSGWDNAGANTGIGAWREHRKPWERAPWWARVFGFKWRRMVQESNAYENASYEYQTTSRRAREFLKEQFAPTRPGEAAMQRVKQMAEKGRYYDGPPRQKRQNKNLTATEIAERFKNKGRI